MKIPFLKPLFIAGIAFTFASCGTTNPVLVSTPVENIDEIPLKVTPLTDAQLKNWGQYDLVADTIPGMSINKAYSQLIKNKTGNQVIVAVLDSGVDITHEDLKSVVWVNKDEIAGNGKDDDRNGYVDDINGWNFLGDAVKENMEYTRIYKRLKSKYDGKPASAISSSDRAEYDVYVSAKAEYEKEYNKTVQTKTQYEQIKQQLVVAHKAVSAQLGKEDYSKKELAEMTASTPEMQQYKAMLTQIQNNVDENIPKALKELDEAIEYYSNRLDSHFNLNLDGRAIVGDNPYDIKDTKYGNN
ncbi:MAG TPA: hypothetical protein VK833_05140, partial [Gillisia sp.]|nr:hypothetical protein [Gillisia sp.]